MIFIIALLTLIAFIALAVSAHMVVPVILVVLLFGFGIYWFSSKSY
jgi:hypothetical protein